MAYLTISIQNFYSFMRTKFETGKKKIKYMVMELESFLKPPETKNPLPLYRQVPGTGRMAQIFNALSLARSIVQTRNSESPEYEWAQMIISALDN